MKYPIIIYPCEEGGYVSEILSLPGCLAQGNSLEECIDELEIVTNLWLESANEQKIPLPDSASAIEKLRSFNQAISI